MKKYDQHVHSSFSFDSKELLENECHEAIRKDLQGLTITEHFSVDPLDVSYGVLQYDAYHQKVMECREQYGGKLQLGCGLEIGEPHLEKCREDLSKALQYMELDFIIGSVHNIGSVKLRNFQKGKSKQEIYEQYFNEILLMVQSADIDVIGHMDLAKRYAFEIVGNYDFHDYKDQIAEILECAIRRDIGIELNTSGWRNSVGISYPSLEVVKLYHDLGGRYITIGSDAHKNEDLASGLERALALLQQAGFRQYYHYWKRTPYPIDLDEA